MLATDNDSLKSLLKQKSEPFWQGLKLRTRAAATFEEFQFLSTLRRKALAQNFQTTEELRPIRLAILGGYTFYPLSLLVEQSLFGQDYKGEIWTGEYDNFVAEILDETSELYSFGPDAVLLLPPRVRYAYQGSLLDNQETVLQELETNKQQLLKLCEEIHNRSGAQVLLGNFVLPCHFDPGPLRVRTLASEWNYFKRLNQEIGLCAPDYVQICDLEFLAARLGGLQVRDDKAWFESKQPFSLEFACHAAKEIAQMIAALHRPSRKVLVLDLDETLWGGIIAEDGLQGIELGDTSARGQSFKFFQRTVQDLAKRGIILAVCSKNDRENAIAPFEQHPEMVLKLTDIAAFSANWNHKSENIKQMAEELNLTLDSFVFVDDNPAEIEIVRQFAPKVASIWLGKDPAAYVQKLQDCRMFETYRVTAEDAQRVELYRIEQERKKLQTSGTDIDSYLESLEMVATIAPFSTLDAPRLAQLINKSNQFNLTTKRRTEADVLKLIGSDSICFSVRLKDRFGDLGLISVVIATPKSENELVIDTWLMSCRVLKRQVEHAAMNVLVEIARERGYGKVIGMFIPTGKNEMVRNFYQSMNFSQTGNDGEQTCWELMTDVFQPFSTKISIERSY